MLNSAYRKTVIEELNRVNQKYNDIFEKAVKDMSLLQDVRLSVVDFLKEINVYISSIANCPNSFEIKMGEISDSIQKFENTIEKLESESKSVDKRGGTVVGAGLFAATGIAAFGPTAVMAVAMTFGTASTGTAIATLSGAAATNAALAWLGGGAIVAGGAGVAGGQAFLALAGPIGWFVGGAALLGGGVYVNYKNKSIAKKAKDSIRIIRDEIKRIAKIDEEVNQLCKVTGVTKGEAEDTYAHLKDSKVKNYNHFNFKQKRYLMKVINLSETLCKQIEIVIDGGKTDE